MLDLGAGVLDLHGGEGMSAAFVAHEQGITLGIVAGIPSAFPDPHQTAIGILAATGGNALGEDGAGGIPADVDHLGSGIGLLEIVCERHGIEFSDGTIAPQDTTRVLPGNGGTGLYLGPGNLGARAATFAALGDEVVDPPPALFVAGIPILHGGVFYLGILHGDELHHGGVQLVFVAHGRGAAFQVTNISTLVGDDQGAFELSGLGGIDAKVGG